MTLPAEVYERRRRRFLDAIGDGAAAIFPAALEAVRSNDVEYRFRQHNDLYYLTGFPEAGAVCLLLPGHPKEEYVLFVRPRDAERETWTGRRAGVEGAIGTFGAAMAYPVDKLDEKIPEYLAERERVYYALDRDEHWTQRVLRWIRQARASRPRTGTGPTAIVDPGEILHEMRLRKEPEEIAHIRRAVAITADAHHAAMAAVRPGCTEFEIEALIDYTFRRAGAAGPAYPTIVASGSNATVLHYTTNDRVMNDGDLVLIDAGAEYAGYCSDITRTFPVGRRFSARQQDIYELVLCAQLAVIEQIRPGVRYDELYQRALAILIEGLLALRLLTGSVDEIREKELFKPYFMHRIGHWLGLDVHDMGDYKVGGESRALEAGMVLTVEPGVYLTEHIEDLGPEWWGIGVRIEDDVLVIPDGHEVLSAAIPKRIDEIEAVRGGAPR